MYVFSSYSLDVLEQITAHYINLSLHFDKIVSYTIFILVLCTLKELYCAWLAVLCPPEGNGVEEEV